jgi:hypothetical protein
LLIANSIKSLKLKPAEVSLSCPTGGVAFLRKASFSNQNNSESYQDQFLLMINSQS